jgi:hypothetical protein
LSETVKDHAVAIYVAVVREKRNACSVFVGNMDE